MHNNVLYHALQGHQFARIFDGPHRELMHLNPSAARSLAEGLEETLTVHRLHVPPQLRKILAGTNVIESAFSIVETVCRNVKRWHGGDQRERRVGSGLLVAERQFRKVRGYKQIPQFMRILETDKPVKAKKTVASKRKAASLLARSGSEFADRPRAAETPSAAARTTGPPGSTSAARSGITQE